MCGLGHLFEKQGIATTVVSLIRLHAEKIAPPRCLWVPFALGRPFGPANDAPFQQRVVRAALELLERDDGPVLEDFPDDEPSNSEGETAWSCPVSFARSAEVLTGAAAVRQSLLDEIAAMQPWYEQARQRDGRTTVSCGVEDLESIATVMASMFEDELPASPDADRSLAEAMRPRAEDLKAFMLEAASAQPGNPTSTELNDWFWNETQTGDILRRLRHVCTAQEAADMKTLGFLLVPLARHIAPDVAA